MPQLSLTVNGEWRAASVPAEMTLLAFLREVLGLTGAKLGCDAGDCGACTVLLDGQAVNACLVLAAQAEGRHVVTIEGIVHPLQPAFEKRAALQCGFCGAGMILSAKALLDANPAPTKQEIREALAGNLCRCTGYTKIVEAVQEAARLARAETSR